MALFKKFEDGCNNYNLDLLKRCYTKEAYQEITIGEKEEFEKIHLQVRIFQIDLRHENRALVRYTTISKEKSTGRTTKMEDLRMFDQSRWRMENG
jgi:hypothetical protein